jgi:hypothetical protein
MSSQAEDQDFGRTFLETIVSWIGKTMKPNDVFNEKQLANWAESRGYEKPE